MNKKNLLIVGLSLIVFLCGILVMSLLKTKTEFKITLSSSLFKALIKNEFKDKVKGIKEELNEGDISFELPVSLFLEKCNDNFKMGNTLFLDDDKLAYKKILELYKESETPSKIGTIRVITKLPYNRIGKDIELMQIIKDNNIYIYTVRTKKNIFIDLLFQWVPYFLVILIVMLIVTKGMRRDITGKSKTFEKNKGQTTFGDIAGLEEVKYELGEIVDFLKNPERFEKMGAKIPKGILLTGSPGTGKTLLAKAVAGEANVKFFSASGAEFDEIFVGVGSSRVRSLFKNARANAPSIIFIDEIDALAKKRNSMGNSGKDDTLNQILIELDGFHSKNDKVVIIGATNKIDSLDSAILRPGRFDRIITVDLPTVTDREEIFKVHCKNKKISNDVNYELLAKKTSGFSGASIANMVNEACIFAVRHEQEEITEKDFEMALEKVLVGISKKGKVVSEKEKKIIAYHEVGHALISIILNSEYKLAKISIIPRQWGALGYTMNLLEEDKYLFTKEEFLNHIKELLGGRATEEVIFNTITTGASNDLQKCTSKARNMIMRYGMNDRIGLLSISDSDTNYERTVSDKTIEIIDDEVRKLLAVQYKETIQIIKDNVEVIKICAEKLLEKETMDGEEFRELYQLIKGRD